MKFSRRLAASTFRAYLVTLVGLMSWRVALTLALMLCAGLTEGISLLLLLPLLQSMGLDVKQGPTGQLAGVISTAFAMLGLHPSLGKVLLVYVLLVCMQSLLNRWHTITSLDLQYQFEARLRQQLYQAITNSNWLFFCQSRSSTFIHALTAELDRVGMATYQFLALISTSILASVYLLLALQLSAAMTGFVFACGVALLFLLKAKNRMARTMGEQISVATHDLYAAITEHLGGMKISKGYGSAERNIAIFSRLTERVTEIYKAAIHSHADSKSWFDIGSVLILSFILYVSFGILGISTASGLLLVFLFARLMPKLSATQQSYQLLTNFLPAFDTIRDMKSRCEAAAESKLGAAPSLSLTESIQLENASFSYNGTHDHWAVRSLNLTIQAARTTAIVGPSGAGKTTIADLITGLILPDRGCIRVDGVPLTAECVQTWRSQIGYVAQETFLFHDTVLANLLWARPDAGTEEIRSCLKVAAADDFVSRLPQGINTILGDRGMRLSAGERQRLALARAFLRKPCLLILDEATSDLDADNEKRIQEAIEALHGKLTILIITHRLLTIRNADLIYVVENGSMVEYGTWDNLITNPDSRFRALCQTQGIAVRELQPGVAGKAHR